MQKILIIEDEAEMARGLKDILEFEGYEVSAVGTGKEGLQAIGRRVPDCIILDLMLPDLNGYQVCEEIRDQKCTVPILMLTAKAQDYDKIRGLEVGADDYMTKPFSVGELLARVKALLRRAQPDTAADEVLRFGRLEIDLGARQARLGGKSCDLTGHQFELLAVLAQAAGRALSRDQIMDALRGHPMEAFDRSIDVHISRIRAAIEEDPKNPQRVLTVRGVGYLFAKRQDAGPDS
jgi:DNA-binding response OmpR family regulator